MIWGGRGGKKAAPKFIRLLWVMSLIGFGGKGNGRRSTGEGVSVYGESSKGYG